MSRPEHLSPEEAIDQMTAESIACRDFSHNWRPSRARRIDGGFERTLRCSTCGSDRVEVLDRFGGLVKRHYEYAEGYLVPGTGRMDAGFRAQVRLTNILRLVEPEGAARPTRRRQKKGAA